MAGKLVFVTGGARSGKSAFAERLAREHAGPVAYIATASAGDAEMARRIEEHRKRRPTEWTTLECEGTLADAIRDAAREHALIIIDCLTIYLARLLPYLEDDQIATLEIERDLEQRVEAEIARIIAALRGSGGDAIVVSNELGSGLVPSYPSGRMFRDMVGRANQQMAREADFAYLVASGVALDLKQLQVTRAPWEGD